MTLYGIVDTGLEYVTIVRRSGSAGNNSFDSTPPAACKGPAGDYTARRASAAG
jgi:hypothetical protein